MTQPRSYLILGNGRWSNVYRSTINKLNKHSIDITSTDDLNTIIDQIRFYKELEKPVTLIMATSPIMQSNMLEKLLDTSIPMILEKPLAYSEQSNIILKKYLKVNKAKTLAGFYNILKPDYQLFRDKILKKIDAIREINIIDGSNGPNRRLLSNFYDWFPHVAAILQTLGMHTLKVDHLRVVKDPLQGFSLTGFYENIKITAHFGTQFKAKTRSISCITKNNEKLTFDFTKITNQQKQEIDKLIGLSEKYFDNHYLNNIYAKNYDSDKFLIDNADLTCSISGFITT